MSKIALIVLFAVLMLVLARCTDRVRADYEQAAKSFIERMPR